LLTSKTNVNCKEYSRSLKLMGNNFVITVLSDDESTGELNIELAIEEIRRIEALLTTYSDNSQANLINSNAGIMPVAVDREVYDLVERCIRISEITQGAFDITYGGINKKLWNFDKTMTALPGKEEALKLVHLVNYRNVLLNKDDCTVFLKEKGMRIGFGGIGKGYAAEMAKKILIENKVESGIINASGDICTWGLQADGKPWTIGIADPDLPSKAFSYLNISDMAIATSGNYEKYVMIDGKKYSHTINPKTGLPVTGIKSVTVISPNAELADAMATPISVMGIQAGLFLINQFPNLHCIIIDDHNEVFTSNKINLQ
jgi:FAD:protein FMN transferase